MGSLRAKRALEELGQNIRRARLARRLAMSDMAVRAGVSEKTIQRLERGDPGVGIGKLSSVLAALGAPSALGNLLAPEKDVIGLSRTLEAVPKRGKSYAKRPASEPSRSMPDGAEDDEGVGF
jgi:transcriptional regulator with XRE-family HTH domain